MQTGEWRRRRRLRPLGYALGLLALLTAPAMAKPDESTFQRRFAKLSAKKSLVVKVSLTEKDTAPSGAVPIATSRMGIHTPPLLTPEDIHLVIQQHMNDIRTCYTAQLDTEPDWSDRLILDLAIKKTGRVGEVSVAPRRVKRAIMGRCLMRKVPKWTFPKFTGETEDGITQEVVNASFPFSFTQD